MEYIYLIVFTFLFSSNCNATTCMPDEEKSTALKRYLEEYAEVTILELSNSTNERLVVIRTPMKFNEYSFSSLILSKNKSKMSDEVDFWVPLAHRAEGSFFVSNFNMSMELLRSTKIEITFNKFAECGISTELELTH